MSALISGILFVLLLSLAASLWRVMRGPTWVDRMLAAQLINGNDRGGDTGAVGVFGYVDGLARCGISGRVIGGD